MKKISLKGVKDGLKRDEMRMISGGSGYGNGQYYCTCGTGATYLIRSTCNCTCFCEGYTSGCL